MFPGTGMNVAYTDEVLERAFAWCDMIDAVEFGWIETAKAIAKHDDLPLAQVWAPEDDGLAPERTLERSTVRVEVGPGRSRRWVVARTRELKPGTQGDPV